jgi:hypothetical protein
LSGIAAIPAAPVPGRTGLTPLPDDTEVSRTHPRLGEPLLHCEQASAQNLPDGRGAARKTVSEAEVVDDLQLVAREHHLKALIARALRHGGGNLLLENVALTRINMFSVLTNPLMSCKRALSYQFVLNGLRDI